MKKTKIEWCNSTWNPVTGCLHGCEYCYARTIANRFGGNQNQQGLKAVWIEEKRESPYPYNFMPTLHGYKLNEYKNLQKRRNVFVCSMADLFGDWVPDEWIHEIFGICIESPQHNYLFLTKNPGRYEEVTYPAGYNHMWYGASITKESEMSLFNQLPAFGKRFVSIEPILEDLQPEKHNILFRQVHWIILGAETGRRKNKVVPKAEWIKAIIIQADKAGTPIFMKESLLPVVGEGNMRREFPQQLML